MRAEVLVLGAGPVGCAVALLLHAHGRAVALRERTARGQRGRTVRPIVLSYASRLILERAGAWQRLAPTPIETIDVSQAEAFGRTRMSAGDAGVPALGYVVDYDELADALAAQVEAAGIGIAYAGEGEPGGNALLQVHAEGVARDASEKRYAQDAVIALVGATPPARSTAHERFTADGPLALLPLRGDYAVVWSTGAPRAAALLAAGEAQFLDALSRACGLHAVRFTALRSRSRSPLFLRVRTARVGERAAFVGNAAQTLHPVAGQGLNLGLRDAWELARAVGDAIDPGAAEVLQRYAARRRIDAFAAIRITDLLAGLFLGGNPLVRAARGAALTALDVCAPARRFFARRMIYGATAIP